MSDEFIYMVACLAITISFFAFSFNEQTNAKVIKALFLLAITMFCIFRYVNHLLA